MAWRRTKKPRSSALPGTLSGDDVQATVEPVADADPAWTSGQNTGIGGARHSVADPQPAPGGYRLRPTPVRYADSGMDDVSAGYEKTPPLDDEPDEPEDGIPILQGIVTTEVPYDDEPPTLDFEPPGPEWNQPITRPPRPVVASTESKPPSFGMNNGATGDQPRPGTAASRRARVSATFLRTSGCGSGSGERSS